MGSAAPQPVGGFIAFFQPEWLLLVVCSGRRCAPPRPFRPLSRSLRLLPSRALSRPTQVPIASAEDLRCCIQLYSTPAKGASYSHGFQDHLYWNRSQLSVSSLDWKMLKHCHWQLEAFFHFRGVTVTTLSPLFNCDTARSFVSWLLWA